jgi:hypothetical protein
MLSRKRHIVYPVNTDIANFDLGTEVEEFTYDGREVFRGNLDPEFSDNEYQVYWLYDENKRVGLAEHTADTATPLWYCLATLLICVKKYTNAPSITAVPNDSALYTKLLRSGSVRTPFTSSISFPPIGSESSLPIRNDH